MKIDAIVSFLIYPGKNIDEPPGIKGVVIPNEGDLYDMLLGIFEGSKSDPDRTIPIMFVSEDQTNPVKDEIIKLASNPVKDEIIKLASNNEEDIIYGKPIAEKLQSATTKNAGIGLLFIIIGSDGEKNKIVISRFPAQEGIVAEMESKSLNIKYVEQVFIKRRSTYKSVMYEFHSSNNDLWTGYAVDKQVSGRTEVAAYWIKGFLDSDFKNRSKQETMELAKAIQKSINEIDDINIKLELVSCASHTNNITKKMASGSNFLDQLLLSSETKKIVIGNMRQSRLSDNEFVFDKYEFESRIQYKIIALDNGAILSAPANTFDECFKLSVIGNETFKYSTQGKIKRVRLGQVKQK